jgi:type II secretory pathway pseudopilin PulG
MLRQPAIQNPIMQCVKSHGASHGNHPAAFTLLELLLALGLSITLLTAVYSALELHWRFSTLGQVEVERGQIARAVLTKMSADIRSVMYQQATDEYDEDESADSASDDGIGTDDSADSDYGIATDSTVVEVTDPVDAYSGDSIGVFGDSMSLVLHIRRPYRQSADSVEQMLNPWSQSDLKSVSYFLAGGQGSLAAMAGNQIQTTTEYEDGIDGLARMSGDRISLTLAASQSDLIEAASQTKVLAEEINSLSFEYHDGVEWLTEWDSNVQGRLPNAIGVTIGFREPDHPEGSILYQAPSESTDNYRIVVPLIVASPFEGLVY